MSAKIKETDIGERVVSWLRMNDHEVWQECNFGQFDPTIDIIARKGSLWIAIECKTSLGLSVLGQAHRHVRSGLAHQYFVAGPKESRRDYYDCSAGRGFFRHCSAQNGIGVIEVDMSAWGKPKVTVPAPLHRNPHRLETMKESLWEASKTQSKAGSSEGGAWSVFRQTAWDLQFFIKRNPGCTLKQAVDGIKHHYASDAGAKSCLSKYINDNVIKGIRRERCGNKLLLFLTDEMEAEMAKYGGTPVPMPKGADSGATIHA